MKSKKKTTRRSRSSTPNLDKSLNKRSIREFIDYDYIKQLSPSERKFLDTFTKNYYVADFRGEDNLIKTKKEKREIYRHNNYRNGDTYNANRTNDVEEKIKDRLDDILNGIIDSNDEDI